MNNSTVYKYLKFLSVFGIFLAIYLFYSFIVKPANPICSINDKVNCEAVTVGPLALFLGIPVSLYGLAGYLFILLFSFFKRPKLILGMATFGMLFCLRLTILEIFYLKVYCPVCLTCQVVMLAIFLLSIKLIRSKEIE